MNMKRSFSIFLLCAYASHAAVTHRSESTANTYQNFPVENGIDYGNVEENEISDEHDSVYGLYPPKANAKDYYDSKASHPNKGAPFTGEYVIDTVNKVLKLSTEEGSHETKLKPLEEIEIKKLSAAFAKIFENSKLENYDWDGSTQTEPSVTETPSAVSTENWRKLSPVITVSKSGVSIAFGNESTPEAEGVTESVEEVDPARDSLWEAIANTVDKVLVDELDRRLNTTDDGTAEDFSKEETPSKEEAEEPSSLIKFVSSVWNVIKSSLDYVGALFGNLMFGKQETQQMEFSNSTEMSTTTDAQQEEENTTVSPTTTVAVFAYEEPTRYKRLPAEEFETRRRDIDSIFYGYGIV